MKGLLGKKVGMTQIFDDDGKAIPVTVVMAGPCYVTQVRTEESEGYASVQLGFGEVNPSRLTGGELGHLNKHKLPPVKFLREFRVKELDVAVGDELGVSVFEVGDRIDVTGTSKGKGFAGTVKRYGFAGGPKTHGQSDRQRAPGSAGAGTTPGRVFKGKRSPGRMGNERKTVQNLEVVLVDEERNLIGIKGAVPGSKGRLVMIKEARKQ